MFGAPAGTVIYAVFLANQGTSCETFKHLQEVFSVNT